MKLRAYKAGQHRGQGMLLSPSIDEYVAEGNPVRAIDAYVDSLDLGALGFQSTRPGSGSGQHLLGIGALRDHCARRKGNPAKMAQYA
jgi:hypothetical protein